ncbi:MAG TPA: hypothetical protein VE689_08965 [Candidatus Udaeobacter sp.]|jgi:hypothetical protein|nr:hypothetical protein [Candidatus Udaeobacter sp.]
MAIWLNSLIVAVLALSWLPSDAQELLKVPVQIPSITPGQRLEAVKGPTRGCWEMGSDLVPRGIDKKRI